MNKKQYFSSLWIPSNVRLPPRDPALVVLAQQADGSFSFCPANILNDLWKMEQSHEYKNKICPQYWMYIHKKGEN
jgi:hypothetical protein